MKIAVISDSHDNLANIKKTFDILKKEEIKILFHCGDLCTLTTLLEILKIFSGKINLAFGNADSDHFRIVNESFLLQSLPSSFSSLSLHENSTTKVSFKKFPNLKVWQEFGEIKIDKKKIAFVHFPEIAKELAATQKYDLIFYGHTHKPWEEKIGKTKLINPGNLAGLFYRATFAVYNTKTDKLELKILN